MPDQFTVAIGWPSGSGNGPRSGIVKVYKYDGVQWLQKGQDINGEALNDESGRVVDMPDSNTLAISAWKNSGNGTNAGHVRIYKWNGASWIQKGSDIPGQNAMDRAGSAVELINANIVAVGVPDYNSGCSCGKVRIFYWYLNHWQQLGQDIIGEAASDRFGTSLSMPDSTTLAIGAPFNDGNGADAGHVRVYKLTGGQCGFKRGTILMAN